MFLLLKDQVVSQYHILVWLLLQMVSHRKHGEKKLISDTHRSCYMCKSTVKMPVLLIDIITAFCKGHPFINISKWFPLVIFFAMY